MAEVTDTIGTTGRDFSTITSWEASLSAHSGDNVTGEMFNDSVFDESVLINDTTPDNIILTVASGERGNGTAATGVRIVRTALSNPDFEVSIDNVDIKFIEFDFNGQAGAASQKWIKLDDTSNVRFNVSLQQCLVHGVKGDGGNSTAIDVQTGCLLMNDILYDITNTHSGGGYLRGTNGGGSTGGKQDYFNVTIHGLTNDNGTGTSDGIFFADNASKTCQNCIVTDTGGTTSGSKKDYQVDAPSNAIMDHNLSSDTTASGTGSLTSKISSNQFVSTVGGSEDLHLKSGADAIDAGVDLVTTPSGVQFDIDNFDRDTEGVVWDMGADEFVVAADGMSSQIAINVRRFILEGV